MFDDTSQTANTNDRRQHNMDFRTLAAQHSQTIDELNQRLTARDKEIGQLKYRLAEIGEQIDLGSARRESAVDHHELHKLGLRVDAAEDMGKDLERQLNDASTRSEHDSRRFAKREAELKQQLANDGSTREWLQQQIESMRNQRNDARSKLACLQKQFEQEKKANRRREFAHDMDKAINRDDYDQDDDEPGLPGYPAPPPKQAYGSSCGPSATVMRSSVGPSSGLSTFGTTPTATYSTRSAPTTNATLVSNVRAAQPSGHGGFEQILPKPSPRPPEAASSGRFDLPNIPAFRWRNADGSCNSLPPSNPNPGPSPVSSQVPSRNSTIGWNQNFSFTAPVTTKSQVLQHPTVSSHVSASAAGSAKPVEPSEARPSLIFKQWSPSKTTNLQSESGSSVSSSSGVTSHSEPHSGLTIRSEPTSQSPKRKRKRTEGYEVAEELKELKSNSFNCGDDLGATSVKRLRSARISSSTALSQPTLSSVSSQSTKTSPLSDDSQVMRRTIAPSNNDDFSFEFVAITSYDREGSVDGHYLSSDIANDLGELWDAIDDLKDKWEDRKGQDWQWEFKKPGYNFLSKPCVTRKLEAKRTNWRPGCQGKYACKDCVEANRPCFTFAGDEDEEVDGWKFWLLPLHEEDRTMAVKEGYEIRYWLNA